MKIIYLITSMSVGGAENQLNLLAENMADKGHKIWIVILHGSFIIKPNNKEIKLVNLNLNKNPLKSIFKFLKLLRSVKPDVIHSHLIHAVLFSRLIKTLKIVKYKNISTMHSNTIINKKLAFIFKYSNYLSHINTNVSLKAVQNFEKEKLIKKDSMEVVYNGVKELSHRNELPQDILDKSKGRKVIVAIGRLTPAKDYFNFISAAKYFDSSKYSFFIVGGGELYDDLNHKISSLKLEDNFFLLGNRNDVPDIIANSDLLVLSSLWEGFPCVIGESMMYKCLFVSTNAGGVSEWLDNSWHDCLVPVSDSSLLFYKMEEYLKLESKKVNEIKKRNYIYVNDFFSIKTITEKWEEIYSRSSI